MPSSRLPNTTPDALEIQALLKKFVDEKAEAVAMEVSSHGLEQGRVNGVRFDCALFTNLSHDHLDYHGTMQAYARGEGAAVRHAGPARPRCSTSTTRWARSSRGA